MKEVLIQMSVQLLPLLGSLLLALLSFGVAKLITLIQAKTKNEWLKGALVKATEAVFNAVHSVEQTMAAKFKEAAADGKITPEEAAQLKAAALESVKSYLGEKGLKELMSVLSLDALGLDKFLADKIEANVAQMKQANP